MSGITFGDVVVVLCVVRAVCATLFTRASQLPRSGGVHEGRRQTRDDERTDDEDVVEDIDADVDKRRCDYAVHALCCFALRAVTCHMSCYA